MFLSEDLRVEQFVDELFTKHGDVGGFDLFTCQQRAWDNLAHIMRDSDTLEGSIVRQDVVDRKLHIV